MFDTIHVRTVPMLQVLVPLLCEAAQDRTVTVKLLNSGIFSITAPRHAFKTKAVKEVLGGRTSTNK